MIADDLSSTEYSYAPTVTRRYSQRPLPVEDSWTGPRSFARSAIGDKLTRIVKHFFFNTLFPIIHNLSQTELYSSACSWGYGRYTFISGIDTYYECLQRTCCGSYNVWLEAHHSIRCDFLFPLQPPSCYSSENGTKVLKHSNILGSGENNSVPWRVAVQWEIYPVRHRPPISLVLRT